MIMSTDPKGKPAGVWPKPVLIAVRRLNELRLRLNKQFVDRDMAVRLLILAALCREHLLTIGVPGGAKTLLASNFAKAIEARRFEMQLTRFSEPSELFGPLDIEQFRNGVYQIRVKDMLADVEIAFLDEVFEANSAVLNTLLTLMNERVFHNGASLMSAPLLTLIGATNHLPEDHGLAAFADRFLLRIRLNPVSDNQMAQLLDVGWNGEAALIANTPTAAPIIRADELRELHRRLAEVDLTPARPTYEKLILRLRRDGIAYSDRRAVRGLKLLAGAALLRESGKAEPEDLWPLRYTWMREDDLPALGAAVDEACGEQPDRDRVEKASPQTLRARLETLSGETGTLNSEVAVFQHLRSLGILRREAIGLSPQDATLNRDIEQVIDTAQRRYTELEGSYV